MTATSPTSSGWVSGSAFSTSPHHGLFNVATPGSTSKVTAASSDDDSHTPLCASDVVTHGLSAEDSLLESPQVYLSVIWHGGKLGAAYYDADTTEMHMMPDTTETEDFSLLKRVHQQVHPVCVILSATHDERLAQALKHPGVEPDGTECQLPSDHIQLLPSLNFSLEVAKRRLLSLNLPSIPEHFTESERTLYMSSLVPIENSNMVRATGGLIKYLEMKRIGVELELDDVKVPVLALHTFSLQDLMVVDDNTYSALQIFHREMHPAGKMVSTKEGLSLFRTLNGCRSRIGSSQLRLWFLHPLKDIGQLQERQEAVAFFANPRNLEVTASLQNCLKHIKHQGRILTRMTRAQATLGDWQSLYKTVYNAIYMAEVCREQCVPLPIFHKIGEKFSDALPKIANLISKIVDFEESAVLNRFTVKPNVDPDLDQMKKSYSGLSELMTAVAREELSKLREDIQSCNMVYLPQLGYLLAIPLPPDMAEAGKHDLPGLKFMFHSNRVAYYRTGSTREMDSQLGDILPNITDRETGIMHRLQNAILEHTQTLLAVIQLAGELDCLVALGVCARAGNYVRPKLTDDNTLHIRAGRHPLQEQCCTPFVPNDTDSGGEYGKMKVVTGPNASGKSVYLKQVALIVFMAQIGSFVPAEEVVVGIADRIFTRVRTMESVSVGLSTFMIDVNQVSLAVRSATERSLVILDEFGKGTSTVDGVSLLCACLKYWLAKEEACPHTFVSTHFHSMVQQQMLPASPQLKYMMMEVLEEGEELVFLYQLTEGSTDSSMACHVMALTGTPQEIVSRAAQVTDLLRLNQPVSAVDADTPDEEQARCDAVAAKFLELDLENDDLDVFLHDFVLPTMGQN